MVMTSLYIYRVAVLGIWRKQGKVTWRKIESKSSAAPEAASIEVKMVLVSAIIIAAQLCIINGNKPNFILMLMDDVSSFCCHLVLVDFFLRNICG